MGRGTELANGNLALSQFPLPRGLAGTGRDPHLCAHACAALTRLHSCWGAGYAWMVHSMWVLWLLGTKRSGSHSLLPLLQWKQIPYCQLNHRKEVEVWGKKEEDFLVLGFLCLALPAPHAQALAELPGSAAPTSTTESGGTPLHWDVPRSSLRSPRADALGDDRTIGVQGSFHPLLHQRYTFPSLDFHTFVS